MDCHSPAADSLSSLHPAVRAWFVRNYAAPSPPQALGWPAIAAGHNVLLLAPTGSGKTFAAFLQCISALYDEFAQGRPLDDGVRVLYISPLKALNNDIHKNLELPLAGIAAEAAAMGLDLPSLRAAIRTGDTPAAERRGIVKKPPPILITTPESLFLMLCSRARETLRRVEYVIVDEIHALFPNKRGVHLAVSLEHLEDLTRRPLQRIGLSATQRPLKEVAAYLGGGTLDDAGRWRARPVEIIDTGQRKELDLRILLPVADLGNLPDGSIWPAIHTQLLTLVRAHRSTLVFVNNRRLAERLAAALNDLAGEGVALVHHGSLARDKRLEAERLLKEGALPCLVATSSLELGIDVGAIDLVIQVESPKEVARGLQRVGRAGHLVGYPSKGRIIPKTRGDLLECAGLVREMRTGLVEEAHAPANCLDVLAQQLVGLASTESRGIDGLFTLFRRACPYRDLPRSQFDRVLAMLAGAYETDRFLELRPRIFWDRVNGEVRAADRGRRLVYTAGGTIPDRGYFGVYLAGTNARLGEVDEEFVAERRLHDRFVLGTSAWRIEEILRDRLIVTPAGRGEAMIPFWRGEAVGRTHELGRRIGGFLDELNRRLDEPGFTAWLGEECLMDLPAAQNLQSYLRAQIASTGILPSDRRLVVEEFQDELGEWRIMLHSPFGLRVHAPLALLLQRQIAARDGLDVETMQDDNGLLFHCPGAAAPPLLDLAGLPLTDLEGAVAETVRGSTLFATLFRHNAARALLLPKAPYGRKRTPLWLARLRAADLLQVASDYPDFPIILETMRECLTGAFDLDGLRTVLSGVQDGGLDVHRVRHSRPSPFSQALRFSFFGAYMYMPDLPKGERRFRALGLDRESLRELLGVQGLRELLDPEAIRATGEEAAGRHERMRNADELHAWLLRYGELVFPWDEAGSAQPYTPKEAASSAPALRIGEGGKGNGILAELAAAGRASLLAWTADGRERQAWVACEEAPYYLAVLPGCHMVRPEADPSAPAPDPNEAGRRLIRRYARTREPFTLTQLENHYGLARDSLLAHLAVLQADGLVQQGEFTPGRNDPEWCDVDLLQRIHRRSLARARREIEPRGPAEYACFLARWQGLADPGRGGPALAAALARLSGLWLPYRAWVGGVLPARVLGFKEEALERLVATGRVSWLARGIGDDLRLRFAAVETNSPTLLSTGEEMHLPSPSRGEKGVGCLLRARGALFLAQIVQGTGQSAADALEALESLMAEGAATNDTLGPVRYFTTVRPIGKRYHLTQAALAEMGRWSLVPSAPPPALEDLAAAFLDRYGLVTRDLAARDGLPWDELATVFDRLEAAGKIRRGYFVKGLGGLQYALPEAVERLRLPVDKGMPEYWALLKCDPSNPYGSILDMPAMDLQPEILVLRRGVPTLAAGGRKSRLVPLGNLEGQDLAKAIGEFTRLAGWEGRDRVTVVEYGGWPIRETEAGKILQGLGFERGYREMVRWSGGWG